MKRGWLFWLVVIAVVVVVVMWLRGDRRSGAPDERLAAHTVAMCKIAERGASAPVDGVRRMMRYYGDRGPAMARDFMDLLVLIERIDDDAAHDARAREAYHRMWEPMFDCERTFERFSRAIAENPEASELLERGVERLSRTISILFGGESASPLLAPLRMLDARVDALTGR